MRTERRAHAGITSRGCRAVGTGSSGLLLYLLHSSTHVSASPTAQQFVTLLSSVFHLFATSAEVSGDTISVASFRNHFPTRRIIGLQPNETVNIAPAEGKLGVLTPGIGAVSTTFMAGVEAIKRGIAQPVGSLTQLATVRLGKRTEGRSPYIRDFVPLAALDDLVFGGWDIYEANAYEAAVNAKVLDQNHLDLVKDSLSAIRPMQAVFDQNYVKRINGPNIKQAPNNMDKARMLMDDIRRFQ